MGRKPKSERNQKWLKEWKAGKSLYTIGQENGGLRPSTVWEAIMGEKRRQNEEQKKGKIA